MQKKFVVYPACKRALDFFGALALLLLLAPLLLLLALAVAADSPGGPLFVQPRVGRGHKLFPLLKFRTMRPGADADAALLVDPGQIFAQCDLDPRRTRLGAFLRKTSLDELPQLANVLLGHMSFVGPRPFVLRESNQLPPLALPRLCVRPGITGYAQAETRAGSAPERLARDLYYVRHVSLGLDVRIVWGTLTGALRGR